jgi:S1-C subfamily serine protease
VPGGPAEEAGIEIGDVITSVDGEDVTEPSDVAAAIADNEPGDDVEIEVERGGEREKLEAELGKRPERTP